METLTYLWNVAVMDIKRASELLSFSDVDTLADLIAQACDESNSASWLDLMDAATNELADAGVTEDRALPCPMIPFNVMVKRTRNRMMVETC